MFLVGTFLIKPHKKSEPEKKFAKHLGMIAGGTGKPSSYGISRERRHLYGRVRGVSNSVR